MRVCGLGGPEVVILALLAFMVFGPDRTREVALQTGRLLRRVMRSPWWQDLTRTAREIRDLPNTLVRLAELEETQAELERNLAGLRDGIEIDLNSPRDAQKDPWGIENAVAESTPPKKRPAPQPKVKEYVEEPPPDDAEFKETPDT